MVYDKHVGARWFLVVPLLLVVAMQAAGDEFVYVRGRRMRLVRAAERVVVRRGARRRRVDVMTAEEAQALRGRADVAFEGPLYQLGDAPVAVPDADVVLIVSATSAISWTPADTSADRPDSHPAALSFGT